MKQRQIFTPQVLEKQKTLDARKKLLKRNATQSELVMKGLLMILVKEKKIPKRVMFQKGLIAGNGYCIIDFYLPFIGLCIEVDGGYHFTPKQQSYDNWKNNYIINERKMRLFRINDKECFDLRKIMNKIINIPEEVIKKLKKKAKKNARTVKNYMEHIIIEHSKQK